MIQAVQTLVATVTLRRIPDADRWGWRGDAGREIGRDAGVALTVDLWPTTGGAAAVVVFLS